MEAVAEVAEAEKSAGPLVFCDEVKKGGRDEEILRGEGMPLFSCGESRLRSRGAQCGLGLRGEGAQEGSGIALGSQGGWLKFREG